MSQPSLQADASALLYELDLCEKLGNRKAPGAVGFKNEISRLKLEVQKLISKTADLEMAYEVQRCCIPRREFDDLAQSIQRLRNNILYLKSNIDVYKQWCHKDSPCSDRNYSSSESATFSPRPAIYGATSISNSRGWLQPPPPKFPVENRYSHFPSQTRTSQHFCSSCGRSSAQSTLNDSYSFCTFCRFITRPWSSSSNSSQTPPHYTYPARPGM